MKKHLLAITTSSVILLCGVMTASAQQGPASPPMQQPNQQQTQTQPDYDEEDLSTGMMGRDMNGEEGMAQGMTGDGRGMMGMRHAMMGHGGMMHHGMRGQGGMMGPLMRLIFALMDADGDGTISLQEFQSAHERIFKAMDVDKDGTVSFEEMMNFMHGRPHRSPSAR